MTDQHFRFSIEDDWGLCHDRYASREDAELALAGLRIKAKADAARLREEANELMETVMQLEVVEDFERVTP